MPIKPIASIKTDGWALCPPDAVGNIKVKTQDAISMMYEKGSSRAEIAAAI